MGDGLGGSVRVVVARGRERHVVVLRLDIGRALAASTHAALLVHGSALASGLLDMGNVAMLALVLVLLVPRRRAHLAPSNRQHPPDPTAPPGLVTSCPERVEIPVQHGEEEQTDAHADGGAGPGRDPGREP